MFSCTRKDKRLSSARKRLMSQLGKRKKTVKNSFEEPAQSATRDQDLETVAIGVQNTQESSEVPSLKDETDGLLINIGPEVSDSPLDSRGGSIPPSSESEYFPTPEKRRRSRVAQPVEPASMGRGMFVCLSSQVSAFLDQINANMACRTPGCSGVYVPVRVVCEGAGWRAKGRDCL